MVMILVKMTFAQTFYVTWEEELGDVLPDHLGLEALISKTQLHQHESKTPIRKKILVPSALSILFASHFILLSKTRAILY